MGHTKYINTKRSNGSVIVSNHKGDIPKASKIEEVIFKELEEKIDVEDWNCVSKFKTYIAVDITYNTKETAQ